MNELAKLLQSGYDWAVHRAADAMNIHNAFITHTLTKEQAVELLNDILDTDELNKVATDFETKTKLVNAITDLINVISAVTSIPGV